MLEPIVLYCKSYEGDIHRVERLWASIEKFNRDNIKFFLSTPEKDRESFRKVLPKDRNLELISDEAIISAGASNKGFKCYAEWPGQLSQQVVKSEFWRLQECENYVALDSDSVFIKPFSKTNFLNPDRYAFTVLSQAKEFLQLSSNKRIEKVGINFDFESKRLKEIFGRNGPDYDFGPTPVIWSAKVWQSLFKNFLGPKEMIIWDAIQEAPTEIRWYGEALLRYKAIPLIPIEPLFRAYLYDWQFHHYKKNGESIDTLTSNYLGIVYQSNWETSLDSRAKRNQKSAISRAIRSSKRYLSRFR